MATALTMYEGTDGKLYYVESAANYAESKVALLDAVKSNPPFRGVEAQNYFAKVSALLDKLLEPGELRPAFIAHLAAIEALPVGVEGFPKEGHSIAHGATSREVVQSVRRRAIRTGEEPDAAQTQPAEPPEITHGPIAEEDPRGSPDTIRSQRRRSSSEARGFDSEGIGPVGRAILCR